jgi:lysyl-tRNA synthetase class 2
LQQLGLHTVDQLKAANPNKLFNDLGGVRKKLKMDVPMPKIDDVKVWVA